MSDEDFRDFQTKDFQTVVTFLHGRRYHLLWKDFSSGEPSKDKGTLCGLKGRTMLVRILKYVRTDTKFSRCQRCFR